MALLIKNLLFTVLVPGTVAVVVPLMIVRDQSPGSAFARSLAVPVLCLGASVYAWCVWDFASFGRGTPLPADAPKALVVRGLYRYVRNPMYLGVLTVILGWALLYRSSSLALYALAVGGLFHLVIVLYEERALRSQFGSEYESYRARVGRWLPFPRRR